VAIVGSGPAGLTTAGELAKWGYEVTVFEALHEYGGVLVYGIPEFRLPKEIVRTESTAWKKWSQVCQNFIVGRSATFTHLKKQGLKPFLLPAGQDCPVS